MHGSSAFCFASTRTLFASWSSNFWCRRRGGGLPPSSYSYSAAAAALVSLPAVLGLGVHGDILRHLRVRPDALHHCPTHGTGGSTGHQHDEHMASSINQHGP